MSFFVALMFCMGVIIEMMGLLWVTGLGLGRVFGVALAHVPRLCLHEGCSN